MQLNAKFATDIDRIVGKIGGTRDRSSIRASRRLTLDSKPSILFNNPSTSKITASGPHSYTAMISARLRRCGVGWGLTTWRHWFVNLPASVTGRHLQLFCHIFSHLSCYEKGIVPADNLDAGTSQEERFKRRWSRLT